MSTDRQVAVDAAAVAAVSVAILLASHELVLMTAIVVSAHAARLALYRRLSPPGGWAAEIVFLVLCTLVGAVNDWLSVVHHQIYDYAVPVLAPRLSTIPLWMLLHWGLILHFVATLSWWHRLGDLPRDRVGRGRLRVDSAPLRIALQLGLVLATRQAIYRTYDDPLWSWLPFALGLVVYALLFGLDRADRRLAVIFAVLGPIVEILYIQVGGLHRYHLGWIGGVPLWIALWWVLAVLVWRDLSHRLHRGLQNWMVRSRWPSSARSWRGR